jgi:gamma-glutamylcyclotransferase (GGCT)/AIG2-like uncharacterized protein YtfP
MTACSRLFVYGTLRRGYAGDPAQFLAQHAEFIRRVQIPGRLYYVGTFADGRPYPGLVSAVDGQVQGDLWEMREPAALLGYLDAYEGLTGDAAVDEYARELVSIPETGEQAWCYRWLRPVLPENWISSGDFLVAAG